MANDKPYSTHHFFDVQPAKPIRAARNGKTMRYTVCVFENVNGDEFYTLRRTAPHSVITECWCGRESGWLPLTADRVGKLYSRYGDAINTLRKLQETDRSAFTAAGRKRHVERLAPRMLEILEALADPDETPNRARWIERAIQTVRIARRGY